MCKAIDAACAMINRAIDLAWETGDSQYHVSYTKAHKLLYLAQCQMLATFDRPLFDEPVYAHGCGPRVDGIDIIAAKYGFNVITEKIPTADFAMPSLFRLSVIDSILRSFGNLDIEELVDYTKCTPAYEEVEEMIVEEYKPELTRKRMAFSAPSIMV